MSGPVIYTNLLGFVPMLLLANVSREYEKFWDFYWSNEKYRLPPISVLLLVLGSLVGTGIGYSGWWCREMISATSFTLIGGEKEKVGLVKCMLFDCESYRLSPLSKLAVLNKCLTILLNVMIWDQHAPPGGIFCLFVCIAGGMVYEQSPMRNERKQITTGITADDEEFKTEINPNVHDDEEMAEPLVDKSRDARRRG
jgi:hypothetical protein